MPAQKLTNLFLYIGIFAYFCRKFSIMQNDNHMEKHFKPYALVALAAMFVTVFSYTTSPLYSELGDTPDSPIFQIIGKYWAEGAIPYKDLWDLKGPYIFLINAIGYGLTGTRTGVYLLQIVFMTFTLLGIFKIYRLHYPARRAMVMTSISLLPLSYIYEGGNLTEEYLLPFLSFSFYYILQWINETERNPKTTHFPVYAILYGVVLGLGLMSRLTNALSLCSATAVIAFTLLCKKEYKNLGLNACAFIVGFGCTTLPFFLYFDCHHALTEMWNATFLYPIEYARNSTKNITDTGLHYFILSYCSSILLLVTAAVLVVRYRKMTIRAWLWFIAAFLPFLWFCQGNGFGHYGMIVFPLFAIAMIEISNLRLKTMFVSVIAIMLIASASKFRYMYILYNWQNTEVADCREFLKKISDIDYSSFVAYNCTPNIYLDLDIRPAVPFFSLQDFAISRNLQLRNDIVSSFQEKQVEWILLSEDDTEQPYIQPILNKYYHIAATQKKGNLFLYKKK